jgi:hypothetical protein
MAVHVHKHTHTYTHKKMLTCTYATYNRACITPGSGQPSLAQGFGITPSSAAGMYVCACVCVCVYIYIYIYMIINTYTMYEYILLAYELMC